ncbi:hypothetical protein VTO42DRAFT_6575 [Malbranchea cinnamomea]
MAPAAVGRARPGQKRPAEDELEGEQRLTKKLGRLRIGRYHQNSKIDLGASPSATAATNGNATSLSSLPDRKIQAPKPQNGDGDAMNIDDTKTRIYIHDLEGELAEIEADEQNHKQTIEFIPEIERKINGLPKRLLRDRDESTPDENNQLVLYRVPSALSIPEEQDSVRRAIAEARQRARAKSAQMATAATGPDKDDTASPNTKTPLTTSTSEPQPEPSDDVDAMDID